MLVSAFHFDLPNELIAQEPLPRGESRLLTTDRRSGEVRHLHVGDLPSLLRAGDLLVVNDTRVFAARLLGHRVPSGGAVECLLLGARGRARRRRFARCRRAGASGPEAEARGAGSLRGRRRRVDGRDPRAAVLRPPHGAPQCGRRAGRDLDALVDALGHVPLPPYIKRRRHRRGSRALPDGLRARPRIGRGARPPACTSRPSCSTRSPRAASSGSPITLHVGYGTFKPVRVDVVEEHVVDPEPYEIVAGSRRGDRARARRGPARHRRRHDDDARARGCGGARRGRRAPRPRGRGALHPPRASRSRSSTGC